ncbi:hypothetical protein SO802_027471 [Lithocarpus litseifolius]|uniref:DNA topoisomerase n=1 Tax=Lithocarpus litseifolius TaxID=425828 RepID=A0AAW2C4C0_9ROSI
MHLFRLVRCPRSCLLPLVPSGHSKIESHNALLEILLEGSPGHNHVRHVLNAMVGLGGGSTANGQANNGHETESVATTTPSTSTVPLSTPSRGRRATASPSISAGRGRGWCAKASPSTSAARGHGQGATASPSISAARGRGRHATTFGFNSDLIKVFLLPMSSSLNGTCSPCKSKVEEKKALKEENLKQEEKAAYTKNFTCKDVSKRQIAVATYLIDKLVLRAGNEKDDDETDTVGCYTLK